MHELSLRRTAAALAAALLVSGVCGCDPAPDSGALAARAAGAAAAPGAFATGAARASELEFTGVWVPVGSFEDPAGPPPWSNTPWPSNPPFTEWGKSESLRLDDHTNFVACSPTGPVYHMWEIGLFPIQILAAPDQLAILRETGGLPRRIYMDGRSHPDDLEPTWQGHSIGVWDGDVLVVDTVGTNGKARAMNGVGSNAQVSSADRQPRMPSSAELHLVERFRLAANGEILEDEMTIVDPKTYTEPVVVKHYFQRRPDIDMLEYYCGDNPRPSDDVRDGGAPPSEAPR